MMATFLAAVDVTIVNTAMPTIVASLGGVHLFSWVITAYMLTSTVTVPIYGCLSDTLGRKATFSIGAGIYLFGSILCGSAQSTFQLIIFRGLQGLGAGAIIPVTQTIIADLYSVRERARIQGIFSSVWGFAALVGPAAGGLISDYIGWRWIFLLKIPIGLASIAMLIYSYNEKTERRAGRIDCPGAVFLVVGLLGILFAGLQGGTAFPWDSPLILVPLAAGLALLVFFIRHEIKTPEPLIPLGLFRMPIIAVSNLANFMIGAVLTGLAAYIPLYAQGVLGGSATSAGMLLAPLSLGWTLGSVVGGRIMVRMGIRSSAVTGLFLQTVGTMAMVYLGSSGTAPRLALMLVMSLVGIGMGFASLALIVGVQNSVGWSVRGTATALVIFVRSLGSTFGVSLMGAALNSRMARALDAAGGQNLESVSRILDSDIWTGLSPETLTLLRNALATGLQAVFWIIAAAAVGGLVLTLFLPVGLLEGASSTADSPRP